MEKSNEKIKGIIKVTTWDDTPGGRKYGVSYASNLKEAEENLTIMEKEDWQAQLAEKFSASASVYEEINLLFYCEGNHSDTEMAHEIFKIVTKMVRDPAYRAGLVDMLEEHDEWDGRETSEWRLTEARLKWYAAEMVRDLFAGKITEEEAQKSNPRAIITIERDEDERDCGSATNCNLLNQ